MQIKKKYKLSTNGYDIYKILSDKNIEYILEEDVVISKKKCIELWDFMEEDKYYSVNYYGYNMPLIDIYFRIIDAKQP